jgi:adenylate kinase
MRARPNRSAWLKGPDFPCDTSPPPLARPLRLVLLGAPGVGKGTQSDLLAGRRGACQLSTGDVFRSARAAGEACHTPAISEALSYMARGQLVPDETVLGLVRERAACLRCRGGFLLDGFPRTVPQAEALEALLVEQQVTLDAVLSLDMHIERIVARLAGRRVCPGCRTVYHVAAQRPRLDDVCDRCGGRLEQRDDDTPEAIRVRMQVYQDSTAPLLAYYRRRRLLIRVSAEGTPEEVYDRATRALDRRLAAR